MNPLNKKLLAGVSLAVLAFGGYAVAQTIIIPTVTSINTNDLFQDISKGAPTSGNVYASALQLRNYILGLNSQRGNGTPLLTSCSGTAAGTITANSTDNAGIITTGTGTSCVVSFNTAYISTPVCSVTSQTAYATSTPSYTVTNAAITLTQANLGGLTYDYVCMAQTGG